MSDNLSLPQAVNPYNDPRIKDKLAQSKQRITDTAPEVEHVVISRIMFSGAAHRWTWALYRTTPLGDSEQYAEIPQADDSDFAVDQNVLKGIFHLYPEVQYLTSHPQQMAFWPSIICKFKRVPKAHGKGTRLALVSFKQCDVYREDEISREEQLQKLIGRSKMNDEQYLHEIDMAEQAKIAEANAAQAEAEQEATAWDELGKPHWCNDKKWFAELSDIKAKYHATAIMEPAEWEPLYHEILNVVSLKDIDPTKMDGPAAHEIIKNVLQERYGKQEWWRNAENVASLKHHLEDTGLPQSLSISPSDVMVEACRAVSVGSVVEWGQAGKSGQEFIIAVKAAWHKQVDELYAKNGKEAAEKEKDAMGTPETQSASAEQPKNGQETTKSNPISEQSKVEPQQITLPEAPFSANFRLLNKLGVDVQFTIRAETVADGVNRVEKTIDALIEKGYTIPAARGVSSASGNGGATAVVKADRGTSPCDRIVVGTSYTGGKLQLQCEVDGFEKPLTFTREVSEMIKLLKPIIPDVSAADIVAGKKFKGDFLCEWKANTKENDKGEMKTYHDVLALRPAA